MTKYLKTKPGSLEDNYQQMFKKELEKSGKSLGSMSDQEKKNFFNKIDKKHKAKSEDLNKDDEKTVKPIIKQLKKSVTAHNKQAKDLEKAVDEAVDPETINNMRDKITKLNDKINTLNKGNPENQSKIAVMQADIEATKLKMREMQRKDAEDRTKTDTAEEVEGEKKMKYKEMKKKTMTNKPKTPVDVNPSVEYK